MPSPTRALGAAALAFTAPWAAAQDGAAARSLAATCTTCHNATGAARGGLPALDGMPAAALAAAMAAFQRNPQAGVMQQLARGYRDEQTALVAAYFAALPGAPQVAPQAAPQAAQPTAPLVPWPAARPAAIPSASPIASPSASPSASQVASPAASPAGPPTLHPVAHPAAQPVRPQ